MNWKSMCALPAVALCVCGCAKSPEQIEDDRRSILESVAADITQAVNDEDDQAIITACDLALLHPVVAAMRLDVGGRLRYIEGPGSLRLLLISAKQLTAIRADPDNRAFRAFEEQYVRREKNIEVEQREFGTLAGVFTKAARFEQKENREPVTVIRQGQSRNIYATVGIVLETPSQRSGSYMPMNDAQLNLITRDCRWLTSRGVSPNDVHSTC